MTNTVFEPSSQIGFAVGKVSAEYARFTRKLARFSKRISHKPRRGIEQLAYARSARAREIAAGGDEFALYRIIGNDLPPRHQDKQSLRNLRFQLDQEAELEGCEKWWVVNRIFDETSFHEIVDLLESRRCNYFVIPFDPEVYRRIPLDDSVFPADPGERRRLIEGLDGPARVRAAVARLRLKNLYVMNNNGARNAALEHGRGRAKWIMPWDGNCFLTEQGWSLLFDGVRKKRHLPYHIVAMARAADNSAILDPAFAAVPNEEPQVVFHRAAMTVFDERRPYGRRPKVDLLQRLNVWGPWMSWSPDPWDVDTLGPSDEEWLYAQSPGWVVRLSSGNPGQEKGPRAAVARLDRRNEAIIAALSMLDHRYNGNGYDPNRGYYDLR